MFQKRSCSLSTKVNWNFYDMIKVRFIVNIFTIYESLLLNVMKILQTILKNKT